MEGVGDETEAVCPHPPQQLHERKGEVEKKKEEEVTRTFLREYSSEEHTSRTAHKRAHTHNAIP